MKTIFGKLRDCWADVKGGVISLSVNAKTPRLTLRIMILMLPFFSSGCLMFASYAIADMHTPRRNVSLKQEHWGGFIPNGDYVLNLDVFIANVPDYSFGLALAPGKDYSDGGYMYWRGDSTSAEYKANPGQWPDMKGIVEAGTLLRLERIYHWEYLIGDKETYLIKARIQNRAWAGELVEICELSKRIPDSFLREPDPLFLAPVAHEPPVEGKE